METIITTTLTAKTKSEVLLSYAERLSASYNIPFKKYIQGKNKTELLRFIEESEKKHGPLAPLPASTTSTTTTPVVKETKMTKKELILEKVRLLPGYKKSWERKSCEELRSLLSTTTTTVPQKIQEEEEIQESGRISPIRITEYVDEEKNRMNLKEAILRAFSDAPYDDIVYPKIQQKVFTS
jgi:hypothetical protein